VRTIFCLALICIFKTKLNSTKNLTSCGHESLDRTWHCHDRNGRVIWSYLVGDLSVFHVDGLEEPTIWGSGWWEGIPIKTAEMYTLGRSP
jgi:hypothetical protein